MVLYADIKPAPIGTFSCVSERDTTRLTTVVFRKIELHVLQLNLSRGLYEILVFKTSGKLCGAL